MKQFAVTLKTIVVQFNLANYCNKLILQTEMDHGSIENQNLVIVQITILNC